MVDNEKEALDRQTKRMIMETMVEQQEQMLAERTINLELLDKRERPPLPKTLVSSMERIQRLLNQLKSVSDINSDQVVEELDALNLKRYIPEISRNITQNRFGARDQQLIVDICVQVHQRYEAFAELLMTDLEKTFKLTPIVEFNKKRNILRTLTELYFKGLSDEY